MTQLTLPPSDIDVDLLDPKNDFVFKKLFATSPTLLAALINAVRSDEPSIEVVEVINPRIDPDELKGKFIVLDILVKDQQGHYYNIEMQVRRYDAWRTQHLLLGPHTVQSNCQRSGLRGTQTRHWHPFAKL